ncbi:MAG: F-type H+-transporting ATPase subunit delta, partial [Lentisphaeria bacterium]
MAELSTLARPYARAAFEHARSAKDLQGWLDALFLASSVSQHATIVALLSSPNLTGEQKSATFIEVCGDKLDAKQQNFIKILAENKRLGLLPKVYQLFDLYKANQEKSIDVVIKTPFKITPALKKKLVAALTKK